MKDILKEVLKNIKPTKEDVIRLKTDISKVISKIKKGLPDCSVILGGSGEKGTFLKDSGDADIFVKFPIKYREKDISEILATNLKKIFKPLRLHGSRDYYQIKIKDFTYEVIPIINIKKAEEAQNITDISPLHAKWVKKHKKYADEIRITKQFFKSAKVYGAESYISGFSGYICEILTIHYKGFRDLIKNISKWKPKEIIDTEKFYANKNKVMFNIDKAKTVGPLIIIDPVQKTRNAAAAVSVDKFDGIITYSTRFLKNPSNAFFETKKFDGESYKTKGLSLFILEISPRKGKKDVIGCQIVKVFNHVKKEFSKYNFKLNSSYWEWNEKVIFYLQIKDETLKNSYNLQGPPMKLKHHVAAFKKKHNNTFTKNKYIFAKAKRKYIKPLQLMKSFSKDKYILERVKEIKILD